MTKHERNLESTKSAANQAVDWYRSLPAENPPASERQNLILNARQILENDPRGFRLKAGQEDFAQPFLLDAACMLIEASRLDDEDSDIPDLKLRAVAKGILKDLAGEKELPASVRWDCQMYLSDMATEDIYNRYHAQEINIDEFNHLWQEQHKRNLTLYKETNNRLAGQAGYQQGKVFEWFYILGRRHQQFRDNQAVDKFVRAALLREDYGKRPLIDGKSDNFDIADEVYDKDAKRWVIKQKVQLTTNEDKMTIYQDDIYELRITVIGGGDVNEELRQRIDSWSMSMRREMDEQETGNGWYNKMSTFLEEGELTGVS